MRATALASPRRNASQENVLLYWIAERHGIYLRRQSGAQPPWTSDPILEHNRFTNVYRRLDRMTQELLREVQDRDPAETLFRTVAYRVFNRSATWASLRDLATPGLWNEREANRRCATRAKRGEKIVTGVWMVSGAAAPGRPIWEGYTETLATLAREATAMAWAMRDARSLAYAYARLQELRGVGKFVGWQIALDLSYTLLADAEDVDVYAYVGPGAVRGLLRLDGVAIPEGKYARLAPKYPGGERAALKALLRWTAWVNERRPPHVPRLSIHDVEHSLCEADKYARALRGEGRPRNGYAVSERPLPKEL